VEDTFMARRRYVLAAVSLGLALAMPLGATAQTTGSPQVQQPDNGGVNWKGAGVGAATLLANVGYIPAKTVYAILGGIAGGAGYALTGGNQQTANSIWRSSLGGDYVVTPAMIRGDEPIHFSGPSVAPEGSQPAASQPISSNPPPAVTASSAPVYPNPPASSPPASSPAVSNPAPAGLGAPPLSSGSSHFTTSITGPGDSGTGPVHDHDIE
jgi:hypothetical protein